MADSKKIVQRFRSVTAVDVDTADKVAVKKALKEFVNAAKALDRSWEKAGLGLMLTKKYPFGSKSFDDVLHDIMTWVEASEAELR